MFKVLIVDDDVELTDRLQVGFAETDLSLVVVHSSKEALSLLTVSNFDLILLDWNLPGIDGLTLCKRFRESNGATYIIFLTGQSDIESKEKALDAGGDDFLAKPFHLRELFARIRSVSRRAPEILSETLQLSGVSLNTADRVATYADKQTSLTKKECAMLEYLMRHPNRPMTAQKLLQAVWPSETDSSVETVRTWMMTLREKLDSIGKPDLIKTVVRSGYVIET